MPTATASTPTNGSMHKSNGLHNVTGTVQKLNGTPVYQVYKTVNYDLFKLMPDNRNINLLHVQRLVQSFKGKHLMSPIIVNEKMEVIDGQHRLAASKETGDFIYYIVVPGYGIKEVQILNTNGSNWKKIDYLHTYCSEGRKPYLEFKEFMNDFPDFHIQSAERILTGKGGSGKMGKIGGMKANMKDFEEGKLFIPNINKSYSHARKIMDFKPYFKDFHRGTFVSSLLPLLNGKVYNHKEMLHKLSNCPIKLTVCPTVESYRMLLEDIYNYKRQKENKVSFRYE